MFHFSFYFEGWAEVFPGFAVVLLCLGLGIHSWNHMDVTLPEVLPPFPVPLFLLNPVLRISSLITYRSRNHTLSIVYLKNCKPQRVGFFWVGFLVGWLVWICLGIFVKTRHIKCTEKVFRLRKLCNCSASEAFLYKISLSFTLSSLPCSSLTTWNYQHV